MKKLLILFLLVSTVAIGQGTRINIGGGRVTTTDNNLTASGNAVNTNKTFSALTDGATVTWNMTTGFNKTLTIGGNRTLAFTNIQAGDYGTLIITQDATGSRTLTLPAGSKVIDGGAGALTLTAAAGAITIISFVYNGTNYFWTYGPNYN